MDYVYRMTWAEFRLRSFAYRRKTIEEWRMVRKLAYTTLTAPYQNPKRIPRREETWMPLADDKKVKYISDEAREAFLTATKNYLSKRNG